MDRGTVRLEMRLKVLDNALGTRHNDREIGAGT
jgi:hypothetical protein